MFEVVMRESRDPAVMHEVAMVVRRNLRSCGC